MNNISSVSFRGGESTGSIAVRRNNQEPCPTCGRVNFKGGGDYYEKEDKGFSWGKALFGTAAVAALAIGGLGYVNKAKVFDKLKDGKVKDTVSKLKPACEKCHEWCATVKTKTVDCWNSVKDKFSKKS